MAKDIIPLKLVVEFENGSFKDGILLYRVNEDGTITQKPNSVSIKNAGFSVPQMSLFIEKVLEHAAKAEGI